MRITIHAPDQASLAALAANLCQEDVDELSAQGSHDPLAVILKGWQTSRECYVAWWDGKPQAVFGVADYPADDRFGVPWMLSTGRMGGVRREFLTLSRSYVESWRPMYMAMCNLVDARHLRAQHWLLHLGFEPFKLHDLNGHHFIEFGILDV